MYNCFINKGQLFQVNHGLMPIIKKFKMNYNFIYFFLLTTNSSKHVSQSNKIS